MDYSTFFFIYTEGIDNRQKMFKIPERVKGFYLRNTYF